MLARPPLCALALAPWVLLAGAHAQPTSAADDSNPMADYLGLLAQIAPAARDGAEAYLRAFEKRCGRALTTPELRRAMSQDSGDPTLMSMIRASQLRDAKALSDLAQRLNCAGQR